MYLQCIVTLAMHQDAYRIGLSYGDAHPYVGSSLGFGLLRKNVIIISQPQPQMVTKGLVLWLQLTVDSKLLPRSYISNGTVPSFTDTTPLTAGSLEKRCPFQHHVSVCIPSATPNDVKRSPSWRKSDLHFYKAMPERAPVELQRKMKNWDHSLHPSGLFWLSSTMLVLTPRSI